MKNLKRSKLMALVLLICMAISVMAPVQVASAKTYTKKKSVSTYRSTATKMKLDKDFQVRKKGYTYFKIDLWDEGTVCFYAGDRSKKQFRLTLYNSKGKKIKVLISNDTFGDRQSDGTFYATKKIDLDSGLYYLEVYKEESAGSAISMSMVAYG